MNANLPKALIWLAIATGLIILLALCGCASLQRLTSDERTQELFNRALERLQARLEEKADKPTDQKPRQSLRQTTRRTRWTTRPCAGINGGFNGSKAPMDANTRISNLTFRGNSLYFKFAQGSCVTLGQKAHPIPIALWYACFSRMQAVHGAAANLIG